MSQRSMKAAKLHPFGAALLLLALAGCTGDLTGNASTTPPAAGSSTDPSAGGSSTTGPCVAANSLPQRIRPLNSAQYANTIRAVFPNAGAVPSPFSLSDRSAEFSTNANLRRFDFNTTETIMTNGQVVADASAAQVIGRFACLAQSPDRNCVTQVVKSLARGVYRAPISEEQATKLATLFENANALAGMERALKLVVRSLLSSPRFLFHRELGQPTTEPGVVALTSHEIANALSYALTDAPPDAALSQAADESQLLDSTKLRQQALRLIGGEQGLTGMQSFMSEFFRTRDFATKEKDQLLFPQFGSETRAEALADFSATIAGVLSSPAPTLESLLTTRQFVVRPRTAALLGWPASQNLSPQGSTLEVSEPQRMGILTHPVFLASFAHPDETNPVARGHFVSSNLLCVNIPPPPQAVSFPTRSNDVTPRTLRQVLEAEHAVGACAGCHQLMDPLGYPFEVFDAVGKLRSTDNGLPIDGSGVISGAGDVDGPIANVEELVGKLAKSTRVRDCFTERVYKYVAGVDQSPNLECATASLKTQFHDNQGNILELAMSVLQSPEFLRRSSAP